MALRKVGGTNRNNFESAALVCTTIIFGLPSSVSDDDVSIDMTTAHCRFFIDFYSGLFNMKVALICIGHSLKILWHQIFGRAYQRRQLIFRFF